MITSTIKTKVIANKPLQKGNSTYYKMTLGLESPIKKIIPGQFIHLKLTDNLPAWTYGQSGTNPLLRRPFTVFDFNGRNSIEVVYQLVGKGTRLMSTIKPGGKIDLLGPLGNGFTINKKADVSLLVGGGIGIACLHLLLKELKGTKYLFIGARTKKDLVLLPLLKKHTKNVIVTTEDGSLGKKGLVTEALDDFICKFEGNIQIYACGPIGMNSAVQEFSLEQKIPAQISLEERMGCGIGLCRVCVCKTAVSPANRGKTLPKIRSAGTDPIPPWREPGLSQASWHWSTVCEDGPVFDAQDLL